MSTIAQKRTLPVDGSAQKLAPRSSIPNRSRKDNLAEKAAEQTGDSTPVKDDHIEVVIRSTSDHSIFVKIESNRIINPKSKRFKSLMNSIERKNLLHLYPIIVNSKMEVLDGQRRLMVSEIKGLRIYYIVDDHFKKNDIATINSSSESWSLESYLHHFVKEEYPEYVRMQEFIDTYKHSVYSALGILSDRTSQPNAELVKAFKDGDFVVKNYEYAERVAKILKDLIPFTKGFSTSKSFVNAVAIFVSYVRDYDHERMMEKAKKYGSDEAFHQAATREAYLMQLFRVYNYQAGKKARVSPPANLFQFQ